MSKNLMTDEYNATLIDIKNIIFQSRDKVIWQTCLPNLNWSHQEKEDGGEAL